MPTDAAAPQSSAMKRRRTVPTRAEAAAATALPIAAAGAVPPPALAAAAPPSSPPQPTPSAAAEAKREWKCAVCSLQNDAEAAACIGCETPRDFDPGRLRVLTWNIAECVASAAAPPEWIPAPRGFVSVPSARAEAAVVATIAGHNPDIICLQESPSERWAAASLGPAGYDVLGAVPSHCGHVVLLVRRHLAHLTDRLAVAGPSVAARLHLPGGRPAISVASSHLAPFKGGGPQRAAQLAALVDTVGAPYHCVLAGDMNMRAAEDRAAEALGAGLVDGWRAAGGHKDTKLTWNSKINKYHQDGFEFVARFDRIYVGGGAAKVATFGLVADTPVEGRQGHFLSDHFGLVCDLEISADGS